MFGVERVGRVGQKFGINGFVTFGEACAALLQRGFPHRNYRRIAGDTTVGFPSKRSELHHKKKKLMGTPLVAVFPEAQKPVFLVN